ncbi:MAG: hypothetical protein M3O92_08630 [Actinomycetota bacterium]|nr:hypothetical protein [Actinomycetota bacterium]
MGGRRQEGGRRPCGAELGSPRTWEERLVAALPFSRQEVFVILEGGGTLELWPSPIRAEDTEREEHEIRAGDVVWRPPSTGIGHFFRGGEEGMTFLAYGTREPNDVCYYPRSNKIYLRGVGLITRLELLGYDDGEPEE